ncbi:MAG: P-II family nitrogen regulator [Peptococcaceae bacterium]
MKEIIAIIRMNKVAKTKNALVKAGFNGLTAAKVMGRGQKLKGLKLVHQVEEDPELRDALLESLLKGGRLIPKRMLTLIVKDEDVHKAVDTIISINKEGKIGDGKIFVLPLLEVIRVRTGENGEAAV